ncbi:MAG TPA: fumarate hydratase, partial [Myxococcota bacterium]|nr:fumarate hydratase [Myxococcota bacterium]
MPAFHFQELFELGDDDTEYRSLGREGVTTQRLGERELLVVEPGALRRLAAAAIRDVSHLFRTSHLKQLRAILDDPEASANDRFVALEMLK